MIVSDSGLSIGDLVEVKGDCEGELLFAKKVEEDD